MKRKLTLPFKGQKEIDNNISQAGQDIFVMSVLDGKKNGKFLDIGCRHPIEINNTYLLDYKFGWSGVLIDLDKESVDLCRAERGEKNTYLCEDSTSIDYYNILKNLNIEELDYISLDVDGEATLKSLLALPLDRIKAKVITFEHDSYLRGDSVRDASRKHLEELGYYRLCADVSNEGYFYEDWYVLPELIDMERVKVLESNKKEWSNIIYI